MVKKDVEKTERTDIDRIEELKAEVEKGLMTKNETYHLLAKPTEW